MTWAYPAAQPAGLRTKKSNQTQNRAPTDEGLLKMLYLAMVGITKKWTGHRQGWGQIHPQLEIYFEERLTGRNL